MKKQTLCLPGLHFPLSKGNQVMVFNKISETGGGTNFAPCSKIFSCLSPGEQADFFGAGMHSTLKVINIMAKENGWESTAARMDRLQWILVEFLHKIRG